MTTYPDDYDLLKLVVDALVASKSPTGELERIADLLAQKGYLFTDEAGHVRLTTSGKALLRRKKAGDE